MEQLLQKNPSGVYAANAIEPYPVEICVPHQRTCGTQITYMPEDYSIEQGADSQAAEAIELPIPEDMQDKVVSEMQDALIWRV